MNSLKTHKVTKIFAIFLEFLVIFVGFKEKEKQK